MKNILITCLSLSLFLFSCDSGPSFTQICKENPEICQEFTNDSWCKRERVSVGEANYQHKLNPQDLEKFNQLIAYENYAKCIEVPTHIEPKRSRDIKAERLANLNKAKNRIKEISKQTESSNHPRLLYYHWTRYVNREALDKFLALEGSKALETHHSQFELATYYSKRDPDKTLRLLFHSLELVKDDQPINVEVLKSLATIYSEKKQAKQSYIWLRVLRLYAPDESEVKESTLDDYIKGYNLDKEFLDKVAETTLSKIRAGIFKSPMK